MNLLVKSTPISNTQTLSLYILGKFKEKKYQSNTASLIPNIQTSTKSLFENWVLRGFLKDTIKKKLGSQLVHKSQVQQCSLMIVLNLLQT